MKKLLHILSRQRSLSLRSLRPHQKAVSSDSDGTFRNHPPSPLTLPSDGSSNGSLGDDDDNNNKDNTEPTTTTTTTQTSDDSASLQESTQLGILKIYEDLYYEHERMLARERPQSKKKKDTVWKKHITNRQNKSGSKSMSAPAAAATATDPPSSSSSSSSTSATSYNMLTRITSFKSVRSSFWKHSQSEPNKPRQQQKRAMICTPIVPAARTSTLLITRVASNASASITEAFLSVDDDDDGHLSIASNEFDDIEDRLSIDTPVFDSLIEQEKDKTDYLLDDEEEADLLLDDDVSSVTSFFGEFEDDLLEVELEMDDGGDEALCGSCTADDLAAYTTMFLQDASTCLGLDAKQEKKPRRGLQQTIRRPAKPTRRAQTAQIIRERVTQLV